MPHNRVPHGRHPGVPGDQGSWSVASKSFERVPLYAHGRPHSITLNTLLSHGQGIVTAVGVLSYTLCRVSVMRGFVCSVCLNLFPRCETDTVASCTASHGYTVHRRLYQRNQRLDIGKVFSSLPGPPRLTLDSACCTCTARALEGRRSLVIVLRVTANNWTTTSAPRDRAKNKGNSLTACTYYAY